MDGQSWGEFMFHIADCQSSWALSVGGERVKEEKEKEVKIEGERKLVLAHDSLSPEPNKRSIVSSLAAKAHDLLVARDRGREGR